MADEREFQADFEPGTEVLDGASTKRRPDAISLDYLRAFSLGPVAIQDPAEGVFDYVWRCRVDNGTGEVYLARETDAGDGWQAETLQFTFDPSVAEIHEVDLAWNQNADPVIVVERPTGSGGGPELWIHFFDPVAGATTFTSFGEGRTPRALLDAPRIPPDSDVLVFYFNDTAGDLVYRAQDDRYQSEQTTGIGSSAGRFVEEVFKRADSRLAIHYSERDAAAGTYSLDELVSTLYPIAADAEGVAVQQIPLSVAVQRVVLQVIGEEESAGAFPAVDGFTEAEGVEVAQEPISVSVRSIINYVLGSTEDPAGFIGDIVGFTDPEGIEVAQEPISAAVTQVILQVIGDTEDPADFDVVNAFTETEGVEVAQEPISAVVDRVILQAYDQPVEGIEVVQEPLSISVGLPVPATGLELLLDAESLSLSDGDPVSTWPDDSGQGNDLSQSGSARPLYRASPTGFGGMPGVEFDGTEDYLQAGAFLSSTEGEIFIVGLGFLAFGSCKASDVNRVFFRSREDPTRFRVTQDDSDPTDGAETGTDDAWDENLLVAGCRSDGTAYSIAVDGVDQAVSTLGFGSGNNTGDWFGDCTGLDTVGLGGILLNGSTFGLKAGVVGEVVVYSRLLSTSERSDIISYLKNKWGI